MHRYRRGRRRWQLISALVSLLCLDEVALADAAGEQTLPARPGSETIFLERIEVENAHHFSPDLLIATSQLEAGRSYLETELHAAADRVARLPLVLDADVSLRKGSERDRYVLVIRVDEARRWFFGLDSDTTFWSEDVSVRDATTTDRVESGSAIVGRRFSVGRYGVAFLALSGDDGLVSVGYSHHELFGRGGVASVSLAATDCDDVGERAERDELGDQGCQTQLFDLGLDPTFSSWSLAGRSARLRLHLGIPIRGDHSIRLRGSVRSADAGIRRRALGDPRGGLLEFDDLRDLELSAGWVHDSLDDPVFPTAGWTAEAGVEIYALAAEIERPGEARRVAELESEVYGLGLSATRHWPYGDGHAWSLGGRAFLGRSRVRDLPIDDGGTLSDDVATWNARLSAGHSRLLFLRRGPMSWRELRWSSGIELTHNGTSPDLGQQDNPLRGLRLSSGLAYRTTWGVFALRLSYFDPEGP